MSVHRPRSAPWSRGEAVQSSKDAPAEPVRDAAVWDQALARTATPAPLNQSWAWGELQGRSGWRVHRLQFGSLGPISVLVQENGPLRWGYVPRGPVGCSGQIMRALEVWARTAGLARIRVEPEIGPEARPVLESAGFQRVKDVNPSHTLIVRLGPDADLLATFRRTTRYNIGYAERHGVQVERGADADELARQVAASASRAGVNLPGVRYLRRLLDVLPLSRTFVARHEGEPLCALLVAVHDGRGYYLYSGSNGHKRQLKAMDLAMWHGMRYAASAGCRDYDMWGIAPNDDPRHPWHGFTEFKRGFGGEEVEYAGTWDRVLSTTANFAVDAHDIALKVVRRLRRLS